MERLTVDPRAKALIFDLDGTLADTMAAHFRAWQRTCATHDIVLTEADFGELAGKTTEQIVAELNIRLGVELDLNQIRAEKDNAYLADLDTVGTIGPVVQVLRKYASALPVALGTNEGSVVANKVVAAIGLVNYFAAVVTSDDVDHPKPDPELFLECASRLNVRPEACQVFEDSKHGIEAAERAGMIATDVSCFV